MNTVQRVYDLIEERNIPLPQLVEMSGVARTTIKSAEKRGGDLSVDTIHRICNCLGISMSDFFAVEETYDT